MATGSVQPDPSWFVHKIAGDLFFKKGHYKEAIGKYTSAVNSFTAVSGSVTTEEKEKRCLVYANRSLSHQKEGNWAQSLEDALSALNLNSDYVKGWFRLGSSLAALQLTDEAVAAFEQGASLAPDNEEIKEARDKQVNNKENSRMPGKISPQLEGTRANVNAFMAKHGIALSKGVSRNSSEDFEAPKGAANAFASGQAGQGMGTSRKAKSRRRKAAKRAAQDATSNGTASSSMSGSSAPSLAREETLSSGSSSSIPCSKEPRQNAESCPPYSSAVSREPQTPAEKAEACKERGNDLYKKHQWQGALEAYTAALELLPTQAQYFGNRAAAHLMLRQYRQAADDCARATELDPAFAKGFARAAKANMCMGNFDKAKEQYACALRLEPQNNAWEEEAKSLGFVKKHVMEGHEALRRGDAQEARWHADVAIRAANPSPELALLLKVQALQKARKFGEALAECRTLTLRGDATAAELLHLRGELHYQSGNMAMAESLYKEALVRDRDNSSYKVSWDRVRNLNRSKDAGNAAFNQGQWLEAHRQYTVALETDPDLRTSFMAQCAANRSATCMRLGKVEAALRDAELAINCDEQYAKGYLRRGVAHLSMKNWEDAIRDFNKVKEMAPEIREVEVHLKSAKLELKKSKRIDFYALLEVSSSATDYEIKKAYKKMALKHHPDKVPPEEREESEAKFKLLGAAHGVLSDADKRQRYDDGWTLEEIEQGYPEGSNGFGHHADFNDVIFSMFGRDGSSRRGYANHSHYGHFY